MASGGGLPELSVCHAGDVLLVFFPSLNESKYILVEGTVVFSCGCLCAVCVCVYVCVCVCVCVRVCVCMWGICVLRGANQACLNFVCFPSAEISQGISLSG